MSLSPVLASPPDALAHARPVVLDNLTTLTVKHWSCILEGELFATPSRARWAVLLRRTFGFDVLKCPRCAAPMRVLATVT